MLVCLFPFCLMCVCVCVCVKGRVRGQWGVFLRGVQNGLMIWVLRVDGWGGVRSCLIRHWINLRFRGMRGFR